MIIITLLLILFSEIILIVIKVYIIIWKILCWSFIYLIKWFSKKLNIAIIMKKKHSDNNDIIIIIIIIYLFIKMITNSNSDLAVLLNSKE